MARPLKNGLEYFSLDVVFYNDIKIRKIVRRKGGDALSVYIVLLCIIYDKGYYLEWNDDVPFLISEATGYQEDRVTEIILYCIENGLFDKHIFEQYHVITSCSIQKRYMAICSLTKRKMDRKSPYFLIGKYEKEVSSEETPVNSEETPINSEETVVNSEETLDDKGLTPKNSGKSTQRKEKEKENIDSSLRSESSSSQATTVSEDKINFLAFQDFFNRTIQQYGSQIPTITQIEGKRRQALNARAREHGKEALRKAVINAATAPFLNGASEKPFVASFDWIFRPTNFVKVLEGTYNHAVVNQNAFSNGTGNNNGYRTVEDLRSGAASIITRMEAEGRQTPE